MKLTILIALLLIGITLKSQNVVQENALTNKNGKVIVSQPGDWSVGVSATPFLEYFGNLLNDNYNYAPILSSSKPGTISFKYQKSASASYRASLLIGGNAKTKKNGSPTNDDEYDKIKTSSLTIGISAGIEKYKGFGSRLRGFYGIEAGLLKSAYNGTLYQSNIPVNGKYKYVGAEDNEFDFTEKGGNTFSLSGTLIIGAEYFIAPKLSISAEFGLGAFGSFTTDRKYVPNDGDEVIFDPGESEFGFITKSTSLLGIQLYF